MRRSVKLRDLRHRDVDAVMAIDAANYQRPWGRRLYLDDIGDARRARHLVAHVGRRVVGHGGVVFLDGDAHISNLTVAAEFRRQGIAARVMRELMELSAEAGCEAMTLEVRVSNQAAIALYERFGFVSEGVRPGYYQDPGGRVDANIMWIRELAA